MTCNFRPISINYLNYVNYMNNQLNLNQKLNTDNRKILENDISGIQKNFSVIVIQNAFQNQLSPSQIYQKSNLNIENQQCSNKQKNIDDQVQNSNQISLLNLFSDQIDSKNSVQFDKQSTSSTKEQVYEQNLLDCLYLNQETISNQLKGAQNDNKAIIKQSNESNSGINNSNLNSQTSLIIKTQNQDKQKNNQTIQNVNELEKHILRVFALRFIRQDMYQYMMIYSKSQNPFSNFKYRQVELTNRIINIQQ